MKKMFNVYFNMTFLQVLELFSNPMFFSVSNSVFLEVLLPELNVSPSELTFLPLIFILLSHPSLLEI